MIGNAFQPLSKGVKAITSSFSGQRRDLLGELNIRDVVDGVALLDDGRMEVGIEVTLPPALGMPDFDDFMTHAKAAIHTTPDYARVRFITMVTESDHSFLEEYRKRATAKEEIAQLLAQSRYSYYTDLWRQGYVLSWKSFVCATVGTKKAKMPWTKDVLTYSKKMFAKAKRVQQRLVTHFSQLGFQPRPLGTQDVFEVCFRYLNPSLAKVTLGNYQSTYQVYPEKMLQANPALRIPSFRAQVAKSTVDNSNLTYLRVGDEYVKCLAMMSIPNETAVGIGNIVLRSGLRQTYVVDFTHLPQDKNLAKIKRRNARTFGNMGSTTYVDSDVDEGLSEGRQLVRHIVQTGDHTFQTSAALFLYANNLDDLNDATVSALSSLASISGSPFTMIDSGVYDPWISLAPFSGNDYLEKVELIESNAVHFLPLAGTWTGSQKPVALYHTRSGALVSVDSFDPRNKNWHTLYLGDTRSGKTFAAQYQMSEALKDDLIEAIIIDRGLSWSNVVRAYNGTIIKIEPGGDTSINPFQLEEGQLKPSEEKKAFLLNILKAMCPSDGGAVEADETAIFAAAIEEVYDAHRSEVKDPATGEYYETLELFTLSDYVKTMLKLSAIGNRRVTKYDEEIASGLARRLQVWTGDSPLGRFIDRPTRLPTSMAKVVLYETSAFDAMPMLDAVGTMLIQSEIWQRARGNIDKKLILAIDEAWAITQNRYSCALTLEIARRGAKEGIALWLITHSLKDLVGEGKDALLGAFNSYFLVRLTTEHELLKEHLKLPEEYLSVFSSLTARKNEYNELLYITRREGGMEAEVLSLRPCPIDYWTFTNHADDLALLAVKTKELGSRENAIKVLAGMKV
jgi:conjugal transfer ATP-binding protein TraC